MPKREKGLRELAARALCEFHGYPPDIKMDGRPMWQSYLEEVDVVLEAAGLRPADVDNNNDNEPEQ